MVALGRPDQGVVDVVRVEHDPAPLGSLVKRIAGLEPDPAEVPVVFETRHGLLVERLVEAGNVVMPVNPDPVPHGVPSAGTGAGRSAGRKWALSHTWPRNSTMVWAPR